MALFSNDYYRCSLVELKPGEPTLVIDTKANNFRILLSIAERDQFLCFLRAAKKEVSEQNGPQEMLDLQFEDCLVWLLNQLRERENAEVKELLKADPHFLEMIEGHTPKPDEEEEEASLPSKKIKAQIPLLLTPQKRKKLLARVQTADYEAAMSQSYIPDAVLNRNNSENLYNFTPESASYASYYESLALENASTPVQEVWEENSNHSLSKNAQDTDEKLAVPVVNYSPRFAFAENRAHSEDKKSADKNTTRKRHRY